MKNHVPDEIRKNCFDCFKSLNEAERAVVMFGEEEYRKSLDLENDDAPCWVMNSGETHGFVGWNPICIPTMDYIVWKLAGFSKRKAEKYLRDVMSRYQEQIAKGEIVRFHVKSLDKLSKDEMRTKIKEFSAILKSQREHWDEENKQGFTYSCDLISQSLITLYIRLGRD